MTERVICFAAHPDDETLGCGATLAKHVANGDAVSVVVFADGLASRGGVSQANIQLRHGMCRRACKILGTEDVWLHQYADNQMDNVALLDVVQHIEKHLDRWKPTIVYTHHGSDLNVDHRVVSEAVATACRPQNGSTVKRLMLFEIPSSSEWNITREQFRPNHFEDVTGTLERKLKALAEYTTELRDWPHPRSLRGVQILAELRGAGAGLQAAEAFMIGRAIA